MSSSPATSPTARSTPSFDDDGFVLTATGRYWNYLYDVLIASDGDIVAVGQFDSSGRPRRPLRRLWCDEVDTRSRTNSTAPRPTRSGRPAVVMDGDVAVYDRELVDLSSWAGTSLTVARQGGTDGSDEFVATGNLGALTEGGALVLSGTTIGTVTTNSGGTLRLDFTAAANRSRVGQTLEALAYRNLTADPGTYTRWRGRSTTVPVRSPTGTVDVTIETFAAVVNSTGDASRRFDR
jgi:large repetitive protein